MEKSSLDLGNLNVTEESQLYGFIQNESEQEYQNVHFWKIYSFKCSSCGDTCKIILRKKELSLKCQPHCLSLAIWVISGLIDGLVSVVWWHKDRFCVLELWQLYKTSLWSVLWVPAHVSMVCVHLLHCLHQARNNWSRQNDSWNVQVRTRFSSLSRDYNSWSFSQDDDETLVKQKNLTGVLKHIK